MNGKPYAVLYHEHSKTGRAGAVLKTKIENLVSGSVIEKTFQGSEKIEEADISKSKAQYLYNEGDAYFFMDTQSYDQFSLSSKVLRGSSQYLIEETEVIILNFNDSPINIELPVKIKFKVVEAPPGIRGDTSSRGDKVVTLETGLKITTPLFIKIDDEVVVNTETGEYASRV